MNIELTEDEVKLLIAATFCLWRYGERNSTRDRASLLGGKLQSILREHREKLDIDQEIVYNENSQ